MLGCMHEATVLSQCNGSPKLYSGHELERGGWSFCQCQREHANFLKATTVSVASGHVIHPPRTEPGYLELRALPSASTMTIT
eukprot:897092-Amphidinium_carterae.2